MNQVTAVFSARRVAALVLLMVVPDTTTDAEDELILSMHNERAQRAVEQRLDQPATLPYINMPLNEAADDISRRFDIPILLDEDAMQDLGVPSTVSVSSAYPEMPLRSALRLMLVPHELTFIVNEDGCLLITTPDVAEYSLSIRLYLVGDLTEACSNGLVTIRGGDTSLDRLVQVITQTIAPESWDNYAFLGGPGSAVIIPEVSGILIRQPHATHIEIERFLDMLRRAYSISGASTGDEAEEASDTELKTVIYRLSTASHEATPESAETAGSTTVDDDHRAEHLPVTFATPQELAAAIQRVIEPNTWDAASGGGVVTCVGSNLIVRQTPTAHRQIQEVLKGLNILAAPTRAPKLDVPFPTDAPERD